MREVVTASREGGASLNVLSGLTAGNFSAFWIGGVTIGCIAMLVSLVSGSIPAKQSSQALVPFLMLAGGVALLKVGQFLSRNEADFLVDFLRNRLDAR